jgi:uncharacterized protein (DUF1778 family)
MAETAKATKTAARARKATRWNLRVTSAADDIVRQAASACHRSFTDFVQDAVLIEAERVLADRTRFVLENERWESFVEMLERPEQEKSALEELFSRPSVFS